MEQPIIIVLVWVFTAGVFSQVIVHGITWFVLRTQDSETDVGRMLTHQIKWLTIKHAAMTLFHFTLAFVITFHRYPFPEDVRIPIYLANIIAFIFAISYGALFVRALLRASRDVTKIGMSAQAERQKQRGAEQTRRGLRQERREGRQDRRESKLDVREGLADVRQDVADVREVVADTRQEVADVRQTNADTRQTAQDDHDAEMKPA